MIIKNFSGFLSGLFAHVGHDLTWATEGDPPTELSVRCLTCGAVLYHVQVVDLESELPPSEDAV